MTQPIKLKPKQLRNISPLPKTLEKLRRQEIYFILDDIMDTYNVGGIFRLADAVTAKKVYLCGITEAPPNHKVKKASVNTWQWVSWEKKPTAQAAIKELRQKVPKIKIIAIEQHRKSKSFAKENYQLPLALIVGHETHVISQAVLRLADGIVELPLFGVNSSLNVIVSLSIVAYKVLEKNKVNK